MAAVLTPDRILKEMADVWRTLGSQAESETGMGVLRACSMTLVVIAAPRDDSQALGETIAALMPEHPARAIVIHPDAAAGRDLTGRAFAQCWMPFGQRRQICCEQIEINASASVLEGALSVAAAIAVPDLPVIVWCRDLRLLERPEFRHVAALGTRIVVDTAQSPDPVAAIRLLERRLSEGVALGDLSWTRLTRWREMISQLFESRKLPKSMQVRVGTISSVSARYMGAWLVDSFRSANSAVTLEFEPGSERVELSGDNLHVELTRSGERLHTVVDGMKHCGSLPPVSDCTLMSEELKIVGHDPIFERTLRSAAVL
jgi:hypothetical protein